MVEVIIVYIICGCIGGFFCAFVAAQKNRSSGNWFLLGFLFNLLALVALIGLPAEKVMNKKTNRICPSCAEEVKIEAKVCRFCNNELPVLEEVKLMDEEEAREIMDKFNIRMEDGKYVYKHFRKTKRFSNLKEAVSYAEFSEKLRS